MNVIFFTQSRSLDVFYQLYLRLKDRIEIDRVGWYVANLPWYEKFLASHPNFEDQFDVLKEWEIHQQADGYPADIARIKTYEDEIGDPTLWGPLVTDRRIWMGKEIRFRQDYKPRFSHVEQLGIMDVALQKIDELFKSVNPDLVCTIYTATFGDCLAHLFAQARGIRSLDLRQTRIGNRVWFVDGVNEPPPHMVELFGSPDVDVPDDAMEQAEVHIRSALSADTLCEGTVLTSRQRKAIASANIHREPLTSQLFSWASQLVERNTKLKKPPYSYDAQTTGSSGSIIPVRIQRKMNIRKIVSSLGNASVGERDLEGLDYILYPLHAEPELMLAQFARPYLNQIEVVRNIALSMPVGMHLLVKEHPITVGRRSMGYYKKLLEIPNVRMADMDLPAQPAVNNARLVVVIRGSLALEVVIRKIPVIGLGISLEQLLPTTMYKMCSNLYELPIAIREMLNSYDYDHDALVRYLAAVIVGSVPANLVSDLLAKPERFRSDEFSRGRSFEEHPHLDDLANHMLERISAGNRLAPRPHR